ncbi:MAG: DUF6076 domain-containing protein [Ruminococcus sp.]|nr:DUF6076 domain-containing protein [Ruminococcus sp.]
MQGYIDVYIQGDKISVGENEYTLGELAVSAMNIGDDVMRQLSKELVNLEKNAYIVREAHIFYKKRLHTDDATRLGYAIEDGIVFPSKDEWRETHKSVCKINELLRTTEIGRAVLVKVELDLEKLLEDTEINTPEYQARWIWYLELVDIAAGYVEDLMAVIRVFKCFADADIARPVHYNKSGLAGLYHLWRYDERYIDFIRYFEDKDKMHYTDDDYMILAYIPYYDPADNEFHVGELFKMDNLQSVVKTDFLRGLMLGHYPKKCAHCGRYFLMTDARNTKYCSYPSLENPKVSCKMMARRKRKPKEMVKNDPICQIYNKCRKAIIKRFQRGGLTETQKKLLIDKAEEYKYRMEMSAAYSREEFEKLLSSEQLYKECGLTPPKRGRKSSADSGKTGSEHTDKSA